MALSSDETIKREIIDHVGIAPFGYEARVFFEGSNDDQKLFEDGGLTFSHNGKSYGSNDCIYVKKEGNKDIPVLAIEGTDALNRGSSGNAQMQRLHHAYGAVLNGVVGVYYLKKGKHKIQEDLYGITYKMSKNLKTPYLVTDELDVIKNILMYMSSDISKMHEYINNYLESSYEKFMKKFNTRYKGSWKEYGKQRSTVIYDDKDYVVKYSSRVARDFTDGSRRGGHVALGELYLSKNYFLNKKIIYLWPRMYLTELNELCEKKKNDKEWNKIITDDQTVVATMDDLINLPNSLKEKLMKLREIDNLNKNPGKKLKVEAFGELNALLYSNEVTLSERVMNRISSFRDTNI